MPIRIEKALEPARSDALGLLKEEMWSYTLDKSPYRRGRAFLIAGHRGAGKTTLVNAAIQEVANDCLKIPNLFRRPLKIPLYAPDLLPPEPVVDATGAKLSDAEMTLRELTLALYQTVAREFAECFSSRIEKSQVSVDFVERAAQLRLELDGAPDAAQLRGFWHSAGFLKKGVLFSTLPAGKQFRINIGSLILGYPFSSDEDGDPQSRGRGTRELVALASAAQAYRRVIGTITEKTEETNKAEKAQQVEGAANIRMDDVANIVFVLLLSAGVGLGATSLGFKGAPASFAAALAALAGGITIKQSWKRSRMSAVDRELTFLPDNSVASLDRVLPLLIDRLHAAGLVPIFVVDELDKVNQLSARMKQLVKQLKHFVTDRAFFCFLSDRNYLEYLQDLCATQAYPEEYTYFTERLLITYRPEQMHHYLQKVLQVAEGDSAGEADKGVLPYYLLRRARLHMFDAQTELAAIKGDEAIKIPEGALRGEPAYRINVLMQIAIEYLLREGDLADRVRLDPEFAQIAYDALYYPAHVWESNVRELDVSEEEFIKYLSGRLTSQEDPSIRILSASGASLAPKDRKVLHDSVKRLVSLIENPKKLKSLVNDAKREGRWEKLPDAAVEAIPVTYSLLKKKQPTAPSDSADYPDLYEWEYNPFGSAFSPPNIESILQDDSLKQAQLRIEKVDEFIRQLGMEGVTLNTFAVELGLVSTSPPWTIVQQALSRLKQLREDKQGYPEVDKDVQNIKEYLSVLVRASRNVGLALSVAAALERFSSQTVQGSRFMDALRTLCRELELVGTPEPSVTSKLLVPFGSQFPGYLAEKMDVNSEDPDFWSWAKEVTSQIGGVRLRVFTPEEERKTVNDAWKNWFDRLLSSLKNTAPISPDFADVATAIGGFRPAGLLKYNLSLMTLADWTTTVTEPLVERESTDRAFCPIWLSFLGLFFVGCGGLLKLFRTRTEERFAGRQNDPKKFVPEIDRIMDVVGGSGVGEVEKVSLVITRTVPSVTQPSAWSPAMWHPSRSHPVLVGSPAQINSFLDGLSPISPPDRLIDTVMIELAQEQVALGTRLTPESLVVDGPILRGLMPHVRPVYLVPQITGSTAPPGFLVAPKSVDEAITRAKEWRERSGARSDLRWTVLKNTRTLLPGTENPLLYLIYQRVSSPAC